jgi:hypothetical protein
MGISAVHSQFTAPTVRLVTAMTEFSGAGLRYILHARSVKLRNDSGGSACSDIVGFCNHCDDFRLS